MIAQRQKLTQHLAIDRTRGEEPHAGLNYERLIGLAGWRAGGLLISRLRGVEQSHISSILDKIE